MRKTQNVASVIQTQLIQTQQSHTVDYSCVSKEVLQANTFYDSLLCMFAECKIEML